MSTIYSVCNNVVVPKIVNNESPIELNTTDVDSFVSGTGKTNDFNLLKYANDSNNIFINFDNETVITTVITNKDPVEIKLSDLSGSFEKLTANTDPPIDTNWAKINYFRRILYQQKGNIPFIIQIYFFKAMDNTWKCHSQYGTLGSTYTNYIIAENSTVQTTSGIPLNGWEQSSNPIDINIYQTSTNSSLTDKLYVSNLDTTLSPINFDNILVNFYDFDGIYTKSKPDPTWSTVLYTMEKTISNETFYFDLYKTIGTTPQTEFWVFSVRNTNKTSWSYMCATSQNTVPMSGWVRTTNNEPNAGIVYPIGSVLIGVNINIYDNAYPPSVNISNATTSDFNGQYFLRVHPDQDASKGNVVYKSNKDKYIIQKTDNTWMTSSDGITAVATNSELENKNLGAVPNSNWSSPDSNIAVSGDMIATVKKTETNP